jgi:hypothetical protein
MNAQNFCLTPSNIPEFLQTVPKSKYVETRSNNTYVVRVFFHIIRQSDGIGGQTLSEVNTAFSILQSDYQPHGISFCLIGIDEIHDDNTYNKTSYSFIPNTNGDGKFANFSPNSHPNAIDIYLFANDKLNSGMAAGIPASALIIGGNAYNINLVTSHVLSHEVGHCLGLYHTFHGLCEGGCEELVNGSNCSSCGDFVCDTPPDPQAHQVDQNTCTWNGYTCGVPNRDANGDYYNPNTSLIMAYISPNCMQYHTQGQFDRMKAMIDNSPILQNVIIPPKNNLILSGTINGTNEYKTTGNISSTQVINSGTTKYEANEVDLNSGFEVKSGSEFEITIEHGCE